MRAIVGWLGDWLEIFLLFLTSNVTGHLLLIVIAAFIVFSLFPVRF